MTKLLLITTFLFLTVMGSMSPMVNHYFGTINSAVAEDCNPDADPDCAPD